MVEAFMRTNAPARAVQYEALQAHAEAVWRQAAASDAAVAAVAKVCGCAAPVSHALGCMLMVCCSARLCAAHGRQDRVALLQDVSLCN